MAVKKKKSGKGRGAFFGAVGTFVRLINLLFVGLLLLSYLAAYISPQQWWPLAFFGLGYPFFLIVNLFFFFFWSFRTRLFALVSLVAILIGWNVLWAHFQINGQKEAVVDPAAIKVMTFNVKQFRGMSNNKLVSRIDEFVTMAGESKADVIVFQEFFSQNATFENNLERIRKATGLKHYTYRTYFSVIKPSAPKHCMVTFSRFPIVNSGEVMKGRRRVGLMTDLAIAGKTIRLINVHFRSNYLNEQDLNLVDYEVIGENSSESWLEGSKKIYWKLRKAFIDRAVHSDLLAAEIERSPYPVIVAGDFNDTPASYSTRTVLAGLTDAFTACGSGYGNTYAGKLPPIRIDYLAASAEFSVANYDVIDRKMSDHYPVVATFILNE